MPNLIQLREARDTCVVAVSRAPLDKITAFKQRMGWTLPWYSSCGSDFNYDFHVTLDEAVAPVEYNYREKVTTEHAGQTWDVTGEQPGVSVFLRDGEHVFHTSALEHFFTGLHPTAHIVSMVGDSMTGGFLTTTPQTMRHVLHSKFWTNWMIGRYAATIPLAVTFLVEQSVVEEPRSERRVFEEPSRECVGRRIQRGDRGATRFHEPLREGIVEQPVGLVRFHGAGNRHVERGPAYLVEGLVFDHI